MNSLLNLSDPLDEVRTRFREVWKCYFDGDLENANRLMNEAVQSHLDTSSFRLEFEEIEKLQRLLTAEKHRWEDVRRTAALVVEQLNGNTDFASELSSSLVVNSPPPPKSKPAESRGSSCSERSQAVAESSVPAGGLDLAGMIDVMLTDERRGF